MKAELHEAYFYAVQSETETQARRKRIVSVAECLTVALLPRGPDTWGTTTTNTRGEKKSPLKLEKRNPLKYDKKKSFEIRFKKKFFEIR